MNSVTIVAAPWTALAAQAEPRITGSCQRGGCLKCLKQLEGY